MPRTSAPKKAKKKPAAHKPRQSQAERRDGTRKRILEATLWCLAKHGYAGTGVQQVVARARVSRGAWSHHFPSMDALILEAAQHLMGRVYERIGNIMRKLAGGSGDTTELIRTGWDEFYASDINEIYLELLIASRRNAKLAAMLGGMARTLEKNLDSVTATHFKPLPQASNNPTELLFLTRWVLRGIALDEPLMPPGSVERALEVWSRLVAGQMQAGSRSRAASQG